MSGNPLEDSPERHHRIRERAYHLWDDEGRPHGRDAEFWERARELVGMEENPESGQLPNPEASGQDPLLDEPVEEAFLQENLGEFPDRFAAQGESQQTPLPDHTAHPPAEAPEKRPKAQKQRPETLPAKPSVKTKAAKPEPAAKKRKPK